VIEQMSPEPTHNVEIAVCRRLTGICPVCRAEIDLGDLDGQSQPEPLRLPPPPSSNGFDNGNS